MSVATPSILNRDGVAPRGKPVMSSGPPGNCRRVITCATFVSSLYGNVNYPALVIMTPHTAFLQQIFVFVVYVSDCIDKDKRRGDKQKSVAKNKSGKHYYVRYRVCNAHITIRLTNSVNYSQGNKKYKMVRQVGIQDAVIPLIGQVEGKQTPNISNCQITCNLCGNIVNHQIQARATNSEVWTSLIYDYFRQCQRSTVPSSWSNKTAALDYVRADCRLD